MAAWLVSWVPVGSPGSVAAVTTMVLVAPAGAVGRVQRNGLPGDVAGPALPGGRGDRRRPEARRCRVGHRDVVGVRRPVVGRVQVIGDRVAGRHVAAALPHLGDRHVGVVDDDRRVDVAVVGQVVVDQRALDRRTELSSTAGPASEAMAAVTVRVDASSPAAKVTPYVHVTVRPTAEQSQSVPVAET